MKRVKNKTRNPQVTSVLASTANRNLQLETENAALRQDAKEMRETLQQYSKEIAKLENALAVADKKCGRLHDLTVELTDWAQTLMHTVDMLHIKKQ